MSLSIKLHNEIPGYMRRLPVGVQTAVQTTAFAIETGIKAEMLLPKHGRIYERPSGPHQASAPGEAPAVDTGNLINSIQTRFPSAYRGVVSTNVEYAEMLEEGTGRIAPRPVWARVAEAEAPEFLRRVQAALNV